MTVRSLLNRPPDVARVEPAHGAGGSSAVRRALRRPVVAALVLVAAYAVLALLCDPGGQLGGDTGARVATLRVMAQGHWPHPDVGYWAQSLDPNGTLHPMWLTDRVGSQWLTIGTVPTLIAGYPLWLLGGYRALLVMPVAGAVLAAFAARRLARQLGSRSEGWVAFWTVGLASPVAVYALDFWDHALGVGLMAWGVATLTELADADGPRAGDGRRSIRPGAVAGLCFGLAATLRTEAFVYAAVAVLAAGLTLVIRRRWAATVAAGAGFLGAAALCLAANDVLERWVLGAALRGGRTSGTLDTAAQLGIGGRLRIAYLSGLALRPGLASAMTIEAVAFAGALGIAAWLGRRGDHRRAAVALVVATLLLGARLAAGLSFVPGILAATPLAVVGLVLGWSDRRAVRLLAIAAASFALVVATQYPQVAVNGFTWAGRYVLVSGLLAAVVGVTALERLDRRALAAGIAMAATVTAFGIGMLAVRTHHMADWTRALTARPESVVISRVPEAFRDAGAGYSFDARWLSAADPAAVDRAFDIADRTGAATVALVEHPDLAGTTVAGWCRGASVDVPWETASSLRITHYERTAGASGPAAACSSATGRSSPAGPASITT